MGLTSFVALTQIAALHMRSLVHVAEMGTPCFAGEFARGPC
jgi:hypothetical protein